MRKLRADYQVPAIVGQVLIAVSHRCKNTLDKTELDYKGPWRNRGYTFYTQMCYRDELPEKLRTLLDKYGLAFDDEWIYFYPKKKKPEARPSAVRRPIWQDFDERFGVTHKSKGY